MATFKERFQNALFGTPTVNYGAENQAYLDELAKQPEFQNLAQRNNLTLDEALAGVMQGRNYSDKNIAQRQQELGINTPKNQEEVALADRGLLNDYTTRQGGLINDFVSGYEENRNNKFNATNLTPNADKGFATRFGEGLGTLARFQNTPLGKGVLAGGLTLALGGGIAPALALGTLANVGRKHSETADKVYRNQLRQLGMSDDEVNAIPGIITHEIYKNIADSYKTRWNKASWADLATISPVVAEAVKLNPELANSYLPASVAKEIMRGDLTEAQIQNLLARTNLIKAQTGQVGKPKVTVNIKQGGTNSTVTHTEGSGGSNRPTKKVDYKNKYGLE